MGIFARQIKKAIPSAPHRACKVLVLTATAAGTCFGLLALMPAQPSLVWNFTASVPLGLYRIEHRNPKRGDLVAIRPAQAFGRTLSSAGVLPRGHLLLKPLIAEDGDMLCRLGAAVRVNGRIVANALAQMGDGRALPVWSGCLRLGQNEIAVLSGQSRSFDSRYFGPIQRDYIVGIARPVFTYLPASWEAK